MLVNPIPPLSDHELRTAKPISIGGHTLFQLRETEEDIFYTVPLWSPEELKGMFIANVGVYHITKKLAKELDAEYIRWEKEHVC